MERGHTLFADSGRASSEIPEWLQEFREKLVDDEVPEHRDSRASSSHEVPLEPTRSADLGKHSVSIHLPRDRHFEIFHRTKITRAYAEDAMAEPVPRAENFGDLMTADHVNLKTIIDMPSSCRSWPPNRSSRIRANKNFSGKTKEPADVLGAR